MNSKDLEKENTRSVFKFKTKLTVLEYEKIISEWNQDVPIQQGWWKDYTPFAEFLLKEMLEEGSPTDLEVNEVNYNQFHFILKRWFLTEKEYETIVRNVGYMKRDAPTLFRETPFFKVYNMMRMWRIQPTMNDLLNMEYKTFMKLYLYSLGENFIVPLGKPKQEGYVG